MFKYEQEIMERNIEYRRYYQDDTWKEFADFMAFCSISVNTKIAIKKYYSLVEGEGYVRVKKPRAALVLTEATATSLNRIILNIRVRAACI